ncbi:MAG: hypothetical protein EHM79_13860 [Geobacter sp.]|nr:MAG: hypothetical protein EHM79_13860 [Geobacter sp.]
MFQLVSFKVGSEEYGIEVLKVREIIRMIPITRACRRLGDFTVS